jgi:hypothetical protein
MAAVCWVCCEGNGDLGELVPQGCACRGSAGLAHVECIAKAAQSKIEQNPTIAPNHMRNRCPTCMQSYTGPMQVALAQLHWDAVKTLPEDDGSRLEALNHLAESVRDTGDFAAALPLQEELVALGRRRYPNAGSTMQDVGNLANLLGEWPAELPRAIKLQEESAAWFEKNRGQDAPGTLHALGCLAGLYGKAGYSLPLRALLEELLPKFQQMAPGDPNTITAVSNLGNA